MSPSRSVPVAVNATSPPGGTLPAGVRAAVTVGARLACVTRTVSVRVSVPPLPSDTVTRAVYVPGVEYVCDGLRAAEVALSPNSHAYVSASASASVAATSKPTGVPVVTSPAGVRVADEITGGLLTGVVQPGMAGTFAPSTWNQSNTASTDVAAALESAKNPICGFAGIAVEARPALVHVVPSVEYPAVRLVPSHTTRM